MYRFRKAAWVLRAFLLSPFFGRLRMPSYIGPPLLVVRSRTIFIERRVRIMPGLRAETYHDGKIRIGEDVSLGQCCHITAMGDLSIGAGTGIAGYSMVTDVDHDYLNEVDCPIQDQPYIHRRTAIGKNCYVGMGARIQAGTILGDGCVVGANSVVRGEFPPYSVIVGVPGRVVKRYDPESGTWKRCLPEKSGDKAG